MHGTKKIAWLLFAAMLLGINLSGFAQVNDKSKDKSSPNKKSVPGGKEQAAQTAPQPASSSKTAPAKDKDGKKLEPAEQPPADVDNTDEKKVRESADAFVTAYNAHDAKAVSELFALKAEFTDEDGNLIKGREAIEQDFATMFTKFPGCKIAVDIDSIRVLTPNIALEEGVVRGQPVPDAGENVSGYVAVHVKIDGRWQIASVSDYDARAEDLKAQDHLQELAWMVGDWLDESPDSTVKSSCRWDASGNYLLHDFELNIAGQTTANGSMRIGWDPLTRQLKSWTFDADSGYSEGLWIRIGDEWLVKSHGVNAAGEVTSSVNVYRFIDNDTLTWRSYDRTVGSQATDDIRENVIKRQAPPPES